MHLLGFDSASSGQSQALPALTAAVGLQAILANGFIFLSGTPGTANTTIEEQTAEVCHYTQPSLLVELMIQNRELLCMHMENARALVCLLEHACLSAHDHKNTWYKGLTGHVMQAKLDRCKACRLCIAIEWPAKLLVHSELPSEQTFCCSIAPRFLC